MEEGEAIEHPWVNKSLEKAQSKVEARNFDIRKQLLKYDDVINDQRKAIFSQRREIMESTNVSEIVRDMRHQLIDDLVDQCMPPKSYPEQWEMEVLQEEAQGKLGIDEPITSWVGEEDVDDEVARSRLYRGLGRAAGQEVGGVRPVTPCDHWKSRFLLHTLDKKWREHLVTIEHLRSVIGFRGYAQRDPLNEFKNEAFGLFEALLNALRTDVSSHLSILRPLTQEEQETMKRQLAERRRLAEAAAMQSRAGTDRKGRRGTTGGTPGRNSPCPCGSGKNTSIAADAGPEVPKGEFRPLPSVGSRKPQPRASAAA